MEAMKLAAAGPFSNPSAFDVDLRTAPVEILSSDPEFLSQLAERINSSKGKRLLDVVGAMGLLAFLLPVLVAIAIAVKLSSPGPVFFRQHRYGRGGATFRMFKFRTMLCTEASGMFVQAVVADPRVTRVGRFLRSTSLDELPQLLNVVLGEMSLVGPRPHAVAMDDFFAARFPGYMNRYAVRPGITGLAQTKGFRGPTVTPDSIFQRLGHDLTYVQRWSLLQDLKLMCVAPTALLGPNAC